MAGIEVGAALADAADNWSVTVVLPTYDEAANLERCVEAVLAQRPGHRVVIVDDASPDGTGDLADALSRRHPARVEVIHRSAKAGLGSAYLAGIRRALAHGCRFVALMDADGSHDPGDLPRLVAVAHDADVVLGSRYCTGGSTPGWPVRRRLLSRIGGRYAAAVLGLPIADPTGGFRVMRRGAVESLDLSAVMATGFAVNLELTWRLAKLGCRVVEAPIAFRARQAGRSKMSTIIATEAAILVWRLRFESSASGFGSKNRNSGSPTSP